MNRAGGIGEIVNLEPLDQLVDGCAWLVSKVGMATSVRRVGRHALAQVEAGQQRGAETAGDQPG